MSTPPRTNPVSGTEPMIRVTREITETCHSYFTREEALDLLASTTSGIDPAIRAHYAALRDDDLADEFGHEVGNATNVTDAVVQREQREIVAVAEHAVWQRL